uniref:VPS37 C-terminal domain-containing protein n=1 Tax=Strigamia maritima TaxID=126957 RepID=T1ITX4_STRMM
MYDQLEPDYGAALSGLQQYGTDELKKLLIEDERLNDMIKNLPQIRNVDMEKEMLMASNKSLAEFNLSREPRLRQARQRLIESYQKASEDFSEVETKKQQLDELSRRISLDTTLAILQTSAAQIEEETETVAEKFLEGSVDVDGFLDEFLPQRKVAHLRRIKVDKLTELLHRSQTRPGSQNWQTGYPGLPTNMPPYGSPI